jgi:hypothetical protein
MGGTRNQPRPRARRFTVLAGQPSQRLAETRWHLRAQSTRSEPAREGVYSAARRRHELSHVKIAVSLLSSSRAAAAIVVAVVTSGSALAHSKVIVTGGSSPSPAMVCTGLPQARSNNAHAAATRSRALLKLRTATKCAAH